MQMRRFLIRYGTILYLHLLILKQIVAFALDMLGSGPSKWIDGASAIYVRSFGLIDPRPREEVR